MTNTGLAQRFATTDKEGKANSMFIEGNTIFSYGYHFPIARKTEKTDENGKKIVLFTNRGYSMTTAKHKGQVWSALYQAGHRIITCDVSMGRVDSEAIEALTNEKQEAEGKEARARKEWSKDSWAHKVTELTNDIATLKQAFSL